MGINKGRSGSRDVSVWWAERVSLGSDAAASPFPQVRAWLRRKALGGCTSTAVGNPGQGWCSSWHSICRIFRRCMFSRIISKEEQVAHSKDSPRLFCPKSLTGMGFPIHRMFLSLDFFSSVSSKFCKKQ